MSLADAFLPAELEYKNRVMHSTWGHLVPPVRQPKPGYIVFCQGAFRDTVVIDYDFKDVKDSPWLCSALHEFADRKADAHCTKVLRFDGTCTLLKNGKFRFSGKVRTVKAR